MDALESLLARNGFLPHGYCFQWSPGLLWTMVSADTLIALAYFSIPLAIISFVRKRPQQNFGGVPWLFSAFIFSCGLTHVMDVWTIWRPDYQLHALVKAMTAGMSAYTALALWPLIPRALRIPSVDALQSVITELQTEVQRRRSVEDHLQEVEQRLAVSLASIGAGFIATDAAGRVTRMNAVAERVTGWDEAAAQGCSVWTVFEREGELPDDRDPLKALLRRPGAAAAVLQAVCLSRFGQRTPVDLNADLTRSSDGSTIGLALIIRDVTRLSQAESAVRRLAAVVESSADAIIAGTLDGRITDWNNAAERMFGYSAVEAVGQPMQVLVPPAQRAEQAALIAQIAAGRGGVSLRTVRSGKDGRQVEVSLTISPIRDALGQVAGIAKTMRDLTHQRLIEAALRRTEARIRFALESAQIGDWEMELDGGEVWRSPRHDRCFGHAEPLLAWSRRALLDHVCADDRPAVEHSLQSAIDGRAEWHAEFRVTWPDASEHWLRMDGRVLPGEPGVSARMVGIVADVTPLRQAEQSRLLSQRLQQENLQILESSRLKSQFLANMSHELRTPLNAIIGFADVLRERRVAPDSPRHHEFISHIATSGRHLLQVINDILDLARIEAGKLELHAAPLDLGAAIDKVVGALAEPAAAKALRITASVDPALHDIVLDPARLEQVIFNFVSNAVKFTPAGGRIAVRALAEDGDHFRLEVEDSGVGIAPDDLPRLFVSFQQLDGGYAKRHQGTGLGLTLTRQLVEAQGGEVGAHSVPGQGSIFHARLPRRVKTLPRMLLAEQAQAVGDTVARELAEGGIAVDAAGSTAEVIRLTRTRRYDGLALALHREGGGLDALAQLRRGDADAPPVRALAASSADGRLAAFAVSNVIAKPLRADEVSDAMRPLQPAIAGGGVVLVVDDDPMARDLMQATLESFGIPTAGAGGGAEALQLLPVVKPAAMVLDLMMPEVDGFQVLHRLREDPAWRDLPVLVWTCMTLTEAEFAVLAASAQAIVEKGGGGVAEVLQALERWAPQRRALPDAAGDR
ncbi:PAS domain S-box protein [Aquincola sp. S2]|uniref:histidine kinase n=1 Tax=Pseudaquabacterium terrae TaxID=2732868 RepID=A0ABX2EG16_9BURK|nr:PAS domain S-box protein [Aquabacterium terrae]NRF67564.1 PAS domain S-box protein [Aquabacterium terrae]